MEDDSPKNSPRDSPRDNPRTNTNICYYEDKMDEIKASVISGYYEDRIKHLEVVIARLLRFMPQLGKPDWLDFFYNSNKYSINIT